MLNLHDFDRSLDEQFLAELAHFIEESLGTLGLLLFSVR